VGVVAALVDDFQHVAGPRIEAVTWIPPVPQPYGSGISREPKGTWWPGMADAFSRPRRIMSWYARLNRQNCSLSVYRLRPHAADIL